MKKVQLVLISPLTGENKRGGGVVAAIALILLLAASLSAAPVLFEAYSEETITIPEDEIDTIPVVELSFSVDTSCYVLFTAGGLVAPAKMFLQLDDSNLFPTSIGHGNPAGGIHIAYTYLLVPGEHNVYLKMTNPIAGIMAVCREAYLQALVFLPDEPDAVTEQPMSDAEPMPNTPSLISQGPYVHIPGAIELVDASGRVIENAIEDDKVFISNLSTGTYFARNGERTVVKIVKVQ